jgi:hypothetical protein
MQIGTKVTAGSVLSAVMIFLAFGDAPDQIANWKAGLNNAISFVGVDWGAFWAGTGGRALLLLLGIAVGLWAWDVPQRIRDKRRLRTDPILAEAARKKHALAQLREYLIRLYDDASRTAIGPSLQQIDNVATMLCMPPADPAKGLAARLLWQVGNEIHGAINAVIATRNFDTEEQRDQALGAWAKLFGRYQWTVFWMNEAYLVLGVSVWSQPDYAKWRDNDAAFVTKMKHLTHMEGCESIAERLTQIGWGDNARPNPPSP